MKIPVQRPNESLSDFMARVNKGNKRFQLKGEKAFKKLYGSGRPRGDFARWWATGQRPPDKYRKCTKEEDRPYYLW